MNEAEFDEFVESAFVAVLLQNGFLESKYGIGRFARWHMDLEKETLSFFDADGNLCIEADVIDIGSYSTKSNTWKWAWSNGSLPPSVREKAEPLRALHAVTGHAMFDQDSSFEVADKHLASRLASVSSVHLNAQGFYAAENHATSQLIFLAITAVRDVRERIGEAVRGKPSVAAILWNDWPSYACAVAIPIVWTLLLLHPASDASQGEGLFLQMGIVATALLAACLLWRLGRIFYLFSYGRDVPGVISTVSVTRDRGRLNFLFEHGDVYEKAWSPIHRTKRVMAMELGQAVRVLIHPSTPNMAVVKDLYL